MSVTVVGSLNEDVVVTVDRLPGRGETVIGSAVAVLLVLDVVLGRGPAIAGCAGVTGLALVIWFALPGWRRSRSGA